MGGSKTSTTQQATSGFQNTNTFGQITPTDTPDIDAARQFQFSIDPAIKQSYGAASKSLTDSYSSPVSGYYSPQMRDASIRSGRARLADSEASAEQTARQGLQGQQYAQKIGLAALTAPQIVQSGSSGSGSSAGSGTTTQSQSIVPALIGGAAQVGAAF